MANRPHQNTMQHGVGLIARSTRGLMPTYGNTWVPSRQGMMVPMHPHDARSQYSYPNANQNAMAGPSRRHMDGGGDYWMGPEPFHDPYGDYPWYENDGQREY